MTDDIQTTDAHRKAQLAFAAHAALLLAELRDGDLINNPFWTALRQDAYERFALALGDSE